MEPRMTRLSSTRHCIKPPNHGLAHTALQPTSGTRAVFSAELGRSKPDPEAFHRLAARLGCAPDEILYFDDDTTYVAGAREAGLSAHRVGGAAGVRASLAAHSLERR
jgi:beta-phosphoglucomutase-like phosphatase (HAD superfamily)